MSFNQHFLKVDILGPSCPLISVSLLGSIFKLIFVLEFDLIYCVAVFPHKFSARDLSLIKALKSCTFQKVRKNV